MKKYEKKINKQRFEARTLKEEPTIPSTLTYKERKPKKKPMITLPNFCFSMKDLKEFKVLPQYFSEVEKGDFPTTQMASIRFILHVKSIASKMKTPEMKITDVMLDKLQPYQIPNFLQDLAEFTRLFHELQFAIVRINNPDLIHQHRAVVEEKKIDMLDFIESLIPTDLRLHSSDIHEEFLRAIEDIHNTLHELNTLLASSDGEVKDQLSSVEEEKDKSYSPFSRPDIISDVFFVDPIRRMIINDVASHMRSTSRALIQAFSCIPQEYQSRFEKAMKISCEYFVHINDLYAKKKAYIFAQIMEYIEKDGSIIEQVCNEYQSVRKTLPLSLIEHDFLYERKPVKVI